MRTAKAFEWIRYPLLILISLIFIFTFNQPPQRKAVSEVLLLPPKYLHLMTFGYREVISDVLWIRTIQDIDYCETGLKFDPTWGSDLCGVENGWVYRMLDAITTLTPSYRSPYAVGAIALSVIVNDKKGAAQLFDRGVTNFPLDWPIQFRAAYHYLYELNDEKKAADLLVLAGKNGAPSWVFALASRLYSKVGRAEVGRAVLLEMIAQNPDDRFADRLRQRLAQIEQDAGADLGETQSKSPPSDSK